MSKKRCTLLACAAAAAGRCRSYFRTGSPANRRYCRARSSSLQATKASGSPLRRARVEGKTRPAAFARGQGGWLWPKCGTPKKKQSRPETRQGTTAQRWRERMCFTLAAVGVGFHGTARRREAQTPAETRATDATRLAALRPTRGPTTSGVFPSRLAAASYALLPGMQRRATVTGLRPGC